ncbi:MAG: hypothetical protein NUV67_01475, partial [archaeon]|nr:hypothetical protein [archaeon]
SSSLDIWFVYHIKNKDRMFEVMSEINMEILRRFESAGLSFAYPSQSVYIESMPKAAKPAHSASIKIEKKGARKK